MDHFKKLPDEMLLKVFSFLGANSLLQCRRVSKRFKLWVDNLALKELAIKDDDDYDECCSWYHTGGSVDPSDFLCVNNLDDPKQELEFFKLFQRLPLDLSKLQRMKIEIESSVAFSDNFENNSQRLVQLLNGFAELEHLEMNVMLELSKETVLRLPILRILLISDVSCHDLVIDAPRLNVLCCNMGLEHVKVATPETVKQIELEYDTGYLKGYRSVEILRYKSPELLEINSIDQILQFCPELRQLHIERPDLQGMVEYEEIKELMNYLLAQKDRLKRENLDVYLFGIKLGDEAFEQQVPADDPAFVSSDLSDDDYPYGYHNYFDSSDYEYDDYDDYY